MRPWSWWLVGVLVGGLAVWGLTVGWIHRERAQLTHWADSTTAVYQAQVAAADRRRAAAQQQADSAQGTRLAAEAQADRERDARLVAERDRARLRASLAVAATAGDSLPLLVRLVATQDTQLVHLEAETGSLRAGLRAEVERSAALVELVAIGDSGMALRDRRIASQDSVIRARLVPNITKRGTLFGFIPLPSRTVTFVIGLAVGVVASRR